MTNTLGKRIKKARMIAGLTQQGLADAIGLTADGKKLSRTTIAQWESGATKEVEAGNLLMATKVLDIRPEWLQFGTGSMRSTTLPITEESSSHPIRTVRVINYHKMMNHMEQNKSEVYIGLDRDLAKVASPDAFAIIISCNSMVPIFQIGDIVIIDPSVKPEPGEIVAAKIPEEKLVVLRKYRPLANPSEEATFTPFELVPLNEDWPRISISSQNQGYIVGTLIEHRCRRRIAHP